MINGHPQQSCPILGVRQICAGFGSRLHKVNASGQCYFMEANLVPGMTAGSSYFPKACEIESEISYDKMIELILDEGLCRVPINLADNILADPLPMAV